MIGTSFPCLPPQDAEAWDIDVLPFPESFLHGFEDDPNDFIGLFFGDIAELGDVLSQERSIAL